MERKIIYVCVLFASFALVLLSSCSSDALVYSCDKEVDVWVKKNMTEIAQMDRIQWVNSGNIDYQRATYRAFTPEQRQSLWAGKFKEILNDIVWTLEETKHIEYMLDFITENLNLFENEISQDVMDEFEIVLFKWKEYAVEELGWTPQLLFAIINTPQSMNADREIAIVENPVVRLRNGTEKDCNANCSQLTEEDSSGNWYVCPAFFHKCKSGECNVTSSGCGTFWMYKCNGTCV